MAAMMGNNLASAAGQETSNHREEMLKRTTSVIESCRLSPTDAFEVRTRFRLCLCPSPCQAELRLMQHMVNCLGGCGILQVNTHKHTYHIQLNFCLEHLTA